MDNFSFDIVSDSEKTFKDSMNIAMSKYKTAVGYKLKGDKLLLYWTKKATTNDVNEFPFPMGVEDVIPFVWSFIKNKEVKEQVDIDGSVGKAFRIYNEAWGHVDDDWDAFCAIEVLPALYGK